MKDSGGGLKPPGRARPFRFDMNKPEAGIASAVVLVPAHLPFPSTASKGDMADEARFLEAACFSN